MRTKNSIQNSIVAIISNVLIIILGFVVQTVFVKTLGEEYLGINGLFNNIISMLAIVELGIGPAIVSNLYKPIADNDTKKINALLKYYKKSYNVIGLLVIIIGLFIMPFLNYFVNTSITFTNYGGIYLIFFLFIIDAAFSYFYAYKRSLIQADQKNRIINITHLICFTLMIIFQIIVLIFSENYILFLIIKIMFRLLENIILSLIVNKNYSYLKDDCENVTKEDKKNIFQKIKGLIYHKISSYLVLGTDNIIISKFLGVGIVGIYSNYYLIINSLYSLICQLFSAITASVGNLISSSSKEKCYDTYKKIMFVNFWIYGFSSTAIFCMMEPFVTIWLGEEFLFTTEVLAILVINYYMLGMRSSIGVFKDAAGIFYEDRFIPIIESLINIVASLILVKYFGLFGVFLGTFLSSLIVVFYSLPHFVFKKLFDKSKREYYKLYLKYALITILSVVLTSLSCNLINNYFITSNLLNLLVATGLSALIPNLLFIVIFRKTDEFNYFKTLVLDKIKNVRRV